MRRVVIGHGVLWCTVAECDESLPLLDGAFEFNEAAKLKLSLIAVAEVPSSQLSAQFFTFISLLKTLGISSRERRRSVKSLTTEFVWCDEVPSSRNDFECIVVVLVVVVVDVAIFSLRLFFVANFSLCSTDELEKLLLELDDFVLVDVSVDLFEDASPSFDSFEFRFNSCNSSFNDDNIINRSDNFLISSAKSTLSKLDVRLRVI